MAREKKKKKEKVENGLKKKTWGPVQTSLSVVGGIAGVVGATVLGVYFAGGFKERVVNPEAISFVYEANLFNADYNQIETCDDFTLTIVAPNQGVTKDKVTLSFNGTNPTIKNDGYISNTIISVPEVVKIGQPFTVSLATEYLKNDEGEYILDNNSRINWIKGGLSSLVATSEYDQLSTTSIQIAVDVPVYRTETIVVNSTGTETNQIVTGESFTLKTKFIPSKSQYMFSDYYEDRNSVLVKNESIGNNAARKKLSYFEAKNNSGVTPVYEDRYNMHFMAGSNAVDSITVTGYTYNTAKAQLDFQTTIVDLSDAEYYNSNIVNLASTEDGVNSVAQVSISEASISTFVVSQNSISAEVNRPFRMYVQENRYEQASKYLGARVVSTSGAILDSMSTKLALAFVYNSQDAVGNVLEVSAIDSGLSVLFGGNEVKLYQPNSNVSDLRYAYWTLTATEKREINVYAYLIVNGEHGDALFRDNNNDVVRYDLTLNVEEHAEGDLIWLDNTKYSVTLSFDETGLNPQTVDLGQFVSVPADNIYKDVVFFAYFGDRTEENAATIDEKAQTVLGVNGYNSTRSGYYSTRGGDIYLYAINGDHATLSGTGEFKLYFATVTGEFYADNTYKIAVMGEGYKEIDCRKALSENSIQGDESDFSEFGTDENIYLDAGNDASFIVSFKVNGESISVFKEEFELQKIQFAAKGSVNSEEIDITQNFKIEDVTFNATTGELSYYLTIDKDKDIQNNLDGGVKITKFVLMQQDSSLVWENEVSSDQSIILYKPVTQTIVVENKDLAGYLNGTSKVSVNQTLTTSGTFSVNIQAGSNVFTKIGSFLDSCFKNKVTITDQLRQTDTLKNKWHFVVSDDDYSIVNLSDNRQSFTFRNGTDHNIVISIKSNDNDTVGKVGDNDVQLILDVTSVGIQKIKQAANNRKFDFIGDMVDATQSTVTVERYGNQTTDEGNQTTDKKIAITNFVKFYLDNDANSEFKNVEFTLSSTYISTLYSNGTLQELFGAGGMITLYSGNNAIGGADAELLKTNLTGTNITAIKINKDFAAEHKIEFLISDNENVGAVNTVFNLKINPNITITSVDYSDLYAEAAFTFTNDVEYKYGTGGSSQTRKLGSLYTAGTTYYIVPKEGSEPLYYYLSTDSANAVGEFKYANAETKIKFYDFWDENSKIYWVRFQPLGENSYLIDQRISFNINRNIIVGAGIKDTYEILESAPNITDFVSIQRSSGSASIPTLTYEFVNDGNNSDYLTIVDGKIAITGKILAFGYNEQELTRTLAVKCGDDEIGRVTIKVKPLNNFYSYIAENFKYSSDDSVVAKIKNVGDVQYLMVDISDNKIQWYFDDSNISARKLAQNSFYNVLSLEYVNLAFVAQNALLYGLNNESAYLDLQFNLGDNKGFSAKVPVIVSQIGFDQVVYDGGSETSSLEHALTRPEDLIKQGIYNEINAGTVTQILNSSSGAGLYTINGNVNSLMFYSFEEINYDNGSKVITARTAQDLIKSIQIDNNKNQQKIMLSLNHLSDSISDMYLAFEYTVINGTLTQTFYYVLRVISDVTVESVIYPYDAGEEHVNTPANTEGQIDLESTFDNTTLHEKEKRFNLSKESGTLEDVAFTNEIYSVTVDDYATYYVKETSGDTLGWSGYIDLNFSDDHSILYFTPKTNNKFAVVIKHSYPGSVDGLSVVGGVQYYTVVINENALHYSLRYMASDNFDNDYESILPDNNNCTWNMTNYVRGTSTYYQEVKADADPIENQTYYIKNNDVYTSVGALNEFEEGVTYYVEIKTKTITINLIENAQAGQSQSGTIVYNELNIHLLSGAVPYYSYNAATGEFVLGLDDYLDQDKSLTFAVYTKYGYLGTLTVNIGANAEFEFKTNASANLQGGTTSTFADIFNIKRDADGVTDYTVTAEITGEGSDFGWCSKLYERYISGYNGTRVNVKYDDCNPFGMIAGDFGEIASLSKHATKPASNSTIVAFDSLSELFATFMGYFEIPTNGSEYIPIISSDASDAYTQFYNKAIELYNGSLVSFTKNISNDLTRSAVIGVNHPYTMTFGTDVSPEFINFQTVIANLFGFSSKAEFMNYAQDLANTYAQHRTNITNSAATNEALENGCFYTSNGSFVFPIAVKNELSSTVLAYVILDTSGLVSVWVNDITAALWATNFNASYHTDSIINNELYCKNILFVTGPDFVTFNNGFTVADLLTDKSISVTFTIKFDSDDKQFIFTQDFTLKQNITPKSSYAPNNYNVISGDEYGLDDVSNFYTGTLGTSTAKIKSVSSTNAAFVSFDDSTGKITTNYVSEPTNLDLTVTVTLTFNNHTQEFQLTYSIVLYPSVELSTTYPNPTEIAEIDAEYIENGSTFNGAYSFVNHAPMFTEDVTNNRRVVAHVGAVQYQNATSYDQTQTYYSYDSDTQTYLVATGVTEENFGDYYICTNEVAYSLNSIIYPLNLEVKITTLQNASVMSGGESIKSGKNVPTSGSITFKRGTYNSVTGLYPDDGTESIVTFTITYRSVVTTYTVKLRDNVISAVTNMASNNVNSQTGYRKVEISEFEEDVNYYTKSQTTSYDSNEIYYRECGNDVFIPTTDANSTNYNEYYIFTQTEDTEPNDNTEYFIIAQIDYEAIYVDQTSTSDMFAKGRMAKVNVASNLTGYKNTYYLVFTQYNKANISQFSNGVTYYILSNGRYVQVEDDAEFENNVTYYTCTNQYYASYPIYFGENDQGKTLTIDLGRSFAGKTFVGAYLASTFDTYITINNSSYGQINYGNGGSVTASGKIYVLVDPEKVAFNPLTTYYTKSGGEYIRAQGITSFDPDKTYYTAIDNLESHLFTSNLTLTNRIQLRYADAYDVDYSYFGSILPQFNIPSNNDIDTLYSTTPFSSDFRANNGSGKNWSLGLTYYYMPKIDIEVEEQIKMDASYQEVTVNIEHQSVVDLFGIKHATTGQNLDKSDFASSGATMTMSLVSAVAEADENIVIDTQNNKTLADAQAKYISEYGRFASGKQYLAFTALLTNNTQAYDYNLLPLGAKNAGDYQLIKITYSISGFTKVFYTVVRISPDYTLSFGGSEGNIQDEGDYTSNVNAYVLTVPASEEYYGDSITHTFTLTSSASASGYLSVKHSNGNDTTSELASTFTITLTTGQNLNGKYYNNATNVANKLMTSNASNWISSTGKYTYNNAGTAVSFKDAPQVIFGNQDYVIEGEDYYGYKYRVYFTLQSKYSIPEATQSTYELTENEYFDIGAEFKLLSIEKESSNNNLYITSETTQPVNENNAKLITLTGINAWLFDKDYVLSDTTYQYLTKNTSDGGYGLKTDPAYSMSTSDKEYLNINNLILNKVTIEGISFSDANGNPLNESITVTGRDLATAKKVDTTNKYTYNGFSGRDAGGGEVDSLVSGVQFYTNEKAQPSGYNGSTKYYYQNGSVFSIFAVTNADYLRDYFTFRQASSYDSNTKYFSYDSTNDKYTLVTSGVDLENFASYFTKEKATVYVNNGNYYYEGSTSDTFEKSNIINSSDYFKDYYTFSEANSYSAGVTYYVYNQVGDSYSKAMNYGDMLQMPRITNTDIFGSSNITNITMNISLKYDGGGTNEEYYTCPVTISLQRGLQIIEHAVLAHDAEPITVSSNYTVQTTNTFSYINDTLEVVIPTNDSITFDMVLKRGSKEIAQAKNVSLSNSGNSFTMTYYMSLSSKFNMNVKVGDKVQISNVRGGCVAMVAMYYITDAKADAATTALTFTGGTAEITIGIITQDKIFVDNALMLQANGYYTTTKYYILKYTEGVKDYYYRLSKMYYVTGKYYKMATQTSQIERVLTYIPGGGNNQTTQFATWSNSINLYSGLVSTTGISNGTAGQTPDLNNLKIEIDSSSGGSGNAEYIDKTGAIKLLSGWSTEQYIKVVVKMRVSGYDRYIPGENDTDNPGYVTLGTLILGSGGLELTFDSNASGVANPESVKTTYGTTLTNLPTPTREGYTFNGWYAEFDGTNYLNMGRDYMYTDHFFVAFDAYMDDWSQFDYLYHDASENGGMRLISSTQAGGWAIHDNANVGVVIYLNNEYIRLNTTTAWTSLASGWHSFAVYYDGTTLKFKLDNTVVSTDVSGKTLTYNSNNAIFVGVEAEGSATDPSSTYEKFTGKIKNLVILNDLTQVDSTNLTCADQQNMWTTPVNNLTLKADWTQNS